MHIDLLREVKGIFTSHCLLSIRFQLIRLW